jgi:hypothetical protein
VPTPTVPDPPCFAIAGHGRSGTSLVASLLQSAGLDIGRRLMAGNEGNQKGYFEDLDFFEFHVNVLGAQGHADNGYILQPRVEVPDAFRDAARALVAERNRAGRPWGWKEPRTTLFLDFWRGLIPPLHAILLFRPPWDVLDSLFRRGDPCFLRNPDQAVRVWLNYNHAALDFAARHPDRCLIVESYAVANDPGRLTAAIAEKFGHHFRRPEQRFDPDAYAVDQSTAHRALVERQFPEAGELYERLRVQADLAADPADLPPRWPSEQRGWALQDWVGRRVAEKNLKAARAELTSVRAELKQAFDGMAWREGQLDLARDAEARLRLELQRSQTAAAELESQLAAARTANASLRELEAAAQGSAAALAERDAAIQQLTTERNWLRDRERHALALADAAGSAAELARSTAAAERDGWDLQLAELMAAADVQVRRLDAARAELDRVAAERAQLAAQNERLDAERVGLRVRIGQLEADAAALAHAAHEARRTADWMGTSKFWKLRRATLALLRPVRHPLWLFGRR